MTLHYISDVNGLTTAVQVQIPIEDWPAFREKYQDFAAQESSQYPPLPQWQKDLLDKELAKIEAGTADLMDWEDFKKELNL